MIEWSHGNRITLLENGEQYFPRALEAIAAAEKEIVLETFIFFEDIIGLQFHRALIAAAERGVRVVVTVDGYGSPEFSESFVASLERAGVIFRSFDPSSRLFGYRLGIFRRLHRKIIAIDERIVFVGGINISEEHVAAFGPMAKQDYAVAVEGPLAASIHAFTRNLGRSNPSPASADAGRPVRAAFVFRDNGRHKNDIEKQYLTAIHQATREITIANAYFFPATRVLHALRRASRRGVTVRLILQGKPDLPMVRTASKQLYDYLLQNGIEIHEYCERPLHAKVAVIDGKWATVGSSNLDPLSLWFNLEANVIIDDRNFATDLHRKLMELQQEQCRRVLPQQSKGYRILRLPLFFLLFHLVRRFPHLLGWLPAHRPRIRPVVATTDAEDTEIPALKRAQ